MLYSYNHNDINNNSTYTNANTGNYKYRRKQANGLLITWLQFFDTRWETQFFYADHTIWPYKRSAHPVVFKISVGRDLQNSNYMPQR